MPETVVSASTDAYIAGIPQNQAPWFDGTRYWIFYQESGTLKCKYGTTLASLSATNTNGGSDIGGISNSGRAYSVVGGFISSTPYIWGALMFTAGSDRIQCWRWECTSSGLGTPTKVLGGQPSLAFNMAYIAPDYGSEVVGTLLWSGVDMTADKNINRSIAADMTGDQGEFNAAYSNPTDPEHARFVKLSDGYVCIHIDEGGSGEASGGAGHLREFRKTSLGDAWGAEQTIEAAGAGNFIDQGYATNTSHTGQQDFCQLDDGTIYVAYCDDTLDTTNSDYGRIIVNKRAATQTGSWTNITTDMIGSSGGAWHLSVSTDGTDVWVFYVKDVSGTRDTAIYYRKYDVSAGTFGPEIKLADLQASHTFERMSSSWRAYQEIVIVWSELNTTYDLMVETIPIAIGSPWYYYAQQG